MQNSRKKNDAAYNASLPPKGITKHDPELMNKKETNEALTVMEELGIEGLINLKKKNEKQLLAIKTSWDGVAPVAAAPWEAHVPVEAAQIQTTKVVEVDNSPPIWPEHFPEVKKKDQSNSMTSFLLTSRKRRLIALRLSSRSKEGSIRDFLHPPK